MENHLELNAEPGALEGDQVGPRGRCRVSAAKPELTPVMLGSVPARPGQPAAIQDPAPEVAHLTPSSTRVSLGGGATITSS